MLCLKEIDMFYFKLHYLVKWMINGHIQKYMDITKAEVMGKTFLQIMKI